MDDNLVACWVILSYGQWSVLIDKIDRLTTHFFIGFPERFFIRIEWHNIEFVVD
jgi:hypothetical protein